jgi:peptide/nickel transport system substrate-binding protein
VGNAVTQRAVLFLVLSLLGACTRAQARPEDSVSTPITYPASDYQEQERGKPGGTLRLTTSSDNGTLDVQVLADTTSKWLGRILYDSLVYLDHEGRPTPWLARSWQISEDGKVYTFRLREGVTFSDGTPFDAEALRINLQRIRDPATRTRMTTAYIAPYVDGKVIDTYTFEAHLSEPYTPFLHVLAQSWFGLYSPRVILQNPKSLAERPVGSGPFVLESYNRQQGAVFVRRPDYDWAPDFVRHQGPAYLERIELSYISEPLARFGGLTSGQHDFTVDVPPQNAASIRANPALRLASRVNLGNPVRVVTMNTQKPPFDDVRVRKAVALAIDRAGIERISGFGEYRLKTDYLSATTLYYDPSFQDALRYNPERANTLLDEAGWTARDARGFRSKAGQPLRAAALFTDAQSARNTLVAVQADLKRVGFELTLEQVPTNVATSRRQSGDYQLTGTGYWHTNTPDGLFIVYDSRNITSARYNGQNNSRLQDAKLDALLDRARQERDPAELRRLYSQAQQRLTEVVPAVPVYENHSIMAWNQAVKNVVFDTSHNMPFFTSVWLDRR